MSNTSLCYQKFSNAITSFNTSDACTGGSLRNALFSNLSSACCLSVDDQSSYQSVNTTTLILASVFGACLFLLSLGIIAYCIITTSYKSNHKSIKSSLIQAASPPNPLQGLQDFTLVVTDIESSTTLWEQVDAEAMNRTLNQHHALIRRLLKAWRGQEEVRQHNH